jgi:hypothetical protein
MNLIIGVNFQEMNSENQEFEKRTQSFCLVVHSDDPGPISYLESYEVRHRTTASHQPRL